jgi:hypothetical protein
MTIFLREPEYMFGCLGFLTARPVRRGIIWLGVALSALAVSLAPTLLIFHRTTPALVGQAIFLVICAWLFVFGLFRLFITFAMWLLDQIGDWISDAIPGLTTPVHFVYLGYWIFFEVFFGLGFLAFLVNTLLLPFGLVQPLL